MECPSMAASGSKTVTESASEMRIWRSKPPIRRHRRHSAESEVKLPRIGAIIAGTTRTDGAAHGRPHAGAPPRPTVRLSVPPGPDTLIQSALDRRNLPALFAALPLLKEIGPASIEALAKEIEWFSIPGGATLYSAGDTADGLYVVINGAFGVFNAKSGAGSRYVGKLSAGHTA